MNGNLSMRRRFKPKASLRARLAQEARQLRDEAETHPPGHKRDSLLRKASQNENTSCLADWLLTGSKASPLG